MSSLEKVLREFEGDREALLSKGIGLLIYSIVRRSGNKLFSAKWGEYVVEIYEPSPSHARKQVAQRRVQQTVRKRAGSTSITKFIKGLEEGAEEGPVERMERGEGLVEREMRISEEGAEGGAGEYGLGPIIERLVDIATREIGVDKSKARELSLRLLDYLCDHPSVGIIRLVEDVLRGYDGDREAARSLLTRLLNMLDDAGIVNIVDGSVVNLVVKLPRRRKTYTLSFSGGWT